VLCLGWHTIANLILAQFEREVIERELWDKVHAVLAKDGHARSVETRVPSRAGAGTGVRRRLKALLNFEWVKRHGS
jgi:hypothetical protein